MNERCPACLQPTTLTPRRVCYDCGEPIFRHNKWTWQYREGVMTSVHRHCDNPDSYHPRGSPYVD